MPNHITNIIEFNCSYDRFVEIATFLKGDAAKPLGEVDFNTLIPMPESLNVESGSRGERGMRAILDFKAGLGTKEELCKKHGADEEGWELGKQYISNLKLYGATTWYDWCCDHWGTKWNAYDCNAVSEGVCELSFLTAWDGVPEIVQTISKKFWDVRIHYLYADEDFGYNVGELIFEDGDVIEENFPDGGSNEAIELAAAVMGGEPEDYGYYKNDDGDYEFNEDRYWGACE